MIGDYTFKINDIDCEPVYNDAMKLEHVLKQNEYYYSATLSGELSFMGVDYDYIMAQPFDTRFNIDIYYLGELYFSGYFARTDCLENIDDHVIKVQLTTDDAYSSLLNGYDKTHNIVPLKPVLQNIQIDKRPLVQVYVAGSKTVSCFLAGSYWEQDVNEIIYDGSKLIGDYHFSLARETGYINITGTSNYPIVGTYTGYGNTFMKTTGDYKIVRVYKNPTYSNEMYIRLVRVSDEKVLYYSVDFDNEVGERTLGIYTNSGATGEPLMKYSFTRIYSRYLTDIKIVRQLTAYDIPINDIVTNNPNYRYVIGYVADTFHITDNYSTEPTEYGRNDIDSYFTPPTSAYGDKFYPIAKDRWILYSIWFSFSYMDWLIETDWRNTYVLKDAFSLSSVIDLLLKQISPSFYFDEANSIFLYGSASVGLNDKLFITPKTNITKSNYNQAAQKAELSLKQILDMLWGVFSCKWHMEGNALHIEHISFYKKGRTYFPVGNISIDLLEETHARYYFPYVFLKNNYSYDKQDLAESIRFKYTDSTTDVFSGLPIKILSNFVEASKIDEVLVSHFNPDVDYMLLNPGNIEATGFALLFAEYVVYANLIDKEDAQFLYNYGLTLEGDVYSSFGMRTSGFIYVNPGENITFIEVPLVICWFRAYKSFITFYLGSSTTVNPPENTMYARVAFSYAQDDLVMVRGLILSGYKVPYATLSIEGSQYKIQNGNLSYYKLIPNYHVYDLPAATVEINGEVYTGNIMLKMIKKQSLWITSVNGMAIHGLIRTNAGNGFIEKMSINLTSRRIDLSLRYDTY